MTNAARGRVRAWKDEEMWWIERGCKEQAPRLVAITDKDERRKCYRKSNAGGYPSFEKWLRNVTAVAAADSVCSGDMRFWFEGRTFACGCMSSFLSVFRILRFALVLFCLAGGLQMEGYVKKHLMSVCVCVCYMYARYCRNVKPTIFIFLQIPHTW